MLAPAAAAGGQAKNPQELPRVAFTAALGALAGQQPGGAPAGAAPAVPTLPLAGSPAVGGTGSEVLDLIADGLELNAREVQNLYAEKNGSPELIVKASKLPKAKS